MTEILHSPPPHLPSVSSSITCVTPTNNDGLHQQININNESHFSSHPVALYRRNTLQVHQVEVDFEEGEEGEGRDQLSVLAALVTVFRKSLGGCKSTTIESGVQEQEQQQRKLMEIGWPTNVRHVAHVTFDRFNGFLGLPVEFEPEVPRRPPSASTRVFGVSTESMQLSFDSRGNCVPTILLMMQRRLYLQGGLEAEGIFRINAENGQEEYVREQLNNGVVPDNIDVHCLAGLIKAWFRELPQGILDSLSPEQVMQAQSEEECTHLARLLPPTEAALLDWAINLMADVAMFEHFNKMNARNVAMVFAPNMTQMADPLTALMYAVQVMNFLKTLIVRTLREREDSLIDTDPAPNLEPFDEDSHHNASKPIIEEGDESNEDEQEQIIGAKQPTSSNTANPFESESQTDGDTHILNPTKDIIPEGKENLPSKSLADVLDLSDPIKEGTNKTSLGSVRTHVKSRRTKTTGQPSNSNVTKGNKKPSQRPVSNFAENAEKSKEISLTSRLNSQTERAEAWR